MILTIADTILLKLYIYNATAKHTIVPYSTTQQGLIECLGKHQPQIAKAGIELERSRLIKRHRAYAHGCESKGKVLAYYLTAKGRRRAEELDKEGVSK